MNASDRPARPHVVVVGAGMAGLAAVRALARAPVTVQLIDAHNYTTFPPLLFQVATCFISPAEVTRPIRGLLRRNHAASFRLGRVAGVDWKGQRVLLDDGDAADFDYLVLAPGVVPAFACPATLTPSPPGIWQPSPHPAPVACARSWRRSPSRPDGTPGGKSAASPPASPPGRSPTSTRA